jgi:hypothetical protein
MAWDETVENRLEVEHHVGACLGNKALPLYPVEITGYPSKKFASSISRASR